MSAFRQENVTSITFKPRFLASSVPLSCAKQESCPNNKQITISLVRFKSFQENSQHTP